MAEGRLHRFWIGVANLATRLRFLAGKASFVEADVEMTTNSVAEVYEGRGRPAGQRLLAHYRLATRPPLGGRPGWRAFLERWSGPAKHLTVSLRCAFCGHLYVVQVLSRLDPLVPESSGRPVARPASYSSDWFRFMHADFEGRPSLSCPKCEQAGEPELERWGSA